MRAYLCMSNICWYIFLFVPLRLAVSVSLLISITMYLYAHTHTHSMVRHECSVPACAQSSFLPLRVHKCLCTYGGRGERACVYVCVCPNGAWHSHLHLVATWHSKQVRVCVCVCVCVCLTIRGAESAASSYLPQPWVQNPAHGTVTHTHTHTHTQRTP